MTRVTATPTPAISRDHPSAPQIVIVGLGPGPIALLTREAEETLLAADRVLFRTAHPAFDWLRERGRHDYCFDLVYQTPRITYDDVYEFIVQAVVREAETRGRAVYAVPGHPFVFENASSMIADRAQADGMRLSIVAGMSFIDLVCTELRIDPWMGLQLCNALDFAVSDPAFTPQAGLLIAQLALRPSLARLDVKSVAECVDRWLAGRFPPTHPVSLVWMSGRPEYATRSRRVPLRDFVRVCAELENSGFAATVYVPPADSDGPGPR